MLDATNREPVGAVIVVSRIHTCRIEVEIVGVGGVGTTRPIVAVGTLIGERAIVVAVAGSGKITTIFLAQLGICVKEKILHKLRKSRKVSHSRDYIPRSENTEQEGY